MDPLFTLTILTLAGLMIVPVGLFVRWLELRAERRAARTPAE
ncbi:MAG: hypothetical protein ABL883_08920 [Terricaulis sp.]